MQERHQRAHRVRFVLGQRAPEARRLLERVQFDRHRRLARRPGAAEEGAPPGVILGVQLADRFFLRVGDEVVLISPLGGAATPLGPAPRMLKFRVAGVFRSEFFQFDESFVYTSLPAAQRFMKLDDVASGIEVRTADAYRSGATAWEIEAALGTPWKDLPTPPAGGDDAAPRRSRGRRRSRG